MAQIPQAAPGRVCPLHQKDVSKVCHKCPWWTLLRGKHPQTGDDLDEWACSIALLPMLLIENSRTTRSVAAATESFRNEMAGAQAQSAEIILAIASAASSPRNPKLLEG
jgi:hypothetical protein